MHIDFWSIALQVVNFAVLTWLLRRFLFRPVMAFVEQRQSAVAATLADADGKRAAAEALRETLSKKLDAVDQEREQILSEAKAAALRERATILDGAELEARAIVEKGKAQLEKEHVVLTARIANRGAQLGTEIATKILTEVAGPDADEQLLARLEIYLAGLPTERLEALQTDLGAGKAVTIATASPMDAAQQKSWRQRLARYLPAITAAEFAVDGALVAGAEIRYPVGVIALTWRKALDDSRSLLAIDDAAA